MDKKKLIISTAMVILLPLLSALMYVGYDLIRAPSIESEIVKHLLWLQFLSVFWRIIVFGIPAALIIFYGYTTGDKITSTLSGVFLIPIFDIYSSILFELLDQDFIMANLSYWLRWNRLIDLTPFMFIYGLMGYFASRRTKASLVVAISLGILMILLILGID
ncbi:hypothetical protein C5S30_03995 [ANME-1 cluster archaeon GoMg4]|nr:hypothetical protein [ANME-1 cluster archaeon GoMg4]